MADRHNSGPADDLRPDGLPTADHLPSDTCTMPPALAEVVAAWTDLPEAVRAGILAMVRASVGG